MPNATRADTIPTQVKDPNLVERRRRQIADAAVRLFVEKGFHKTTTRQIARAADISIGSLYEYFTTKEDILYIVCDFIHTEMERGVATAMA
jgi:AcrR family transcriptional regulator